MPVVSDFSTVSGINTASRLLQSLSGHQKPQGMKYIHSFLPTFLNT